MLKTCLYLYSDNNNEVIINKKNIMENTEKFKKELKKDILRKAITRTKDHCLFNGLKFPTGKEMNEIAIENLKFDFPETYKTYLSL